ncbi:MAG: translation initiation factor IF-3 [Planctomycetes bacterium]|nr:translation initiation factor IF-3 [Planctomycetota bacterium]
MSRPESNSAFGPRINDRIRITPVRLIDETGTMLGVVETEEARRLAMVAGLDLVEIAPDVRPPVCKIMDFGKYKYEQSKKDKQGRKTKTSEMKEVRLGRSMKVDPHDVEIRVQQARRFLLEGHKVQLVASYKGREMAHKEIGAVKLNAAIAKLTDLARLDSPPRFNGKRLSAMLSPDRARIDAFKRKNPALFKAPKPEAAKSETTKAESSKSTEPADDGAPTTAETTAKKPKKTAKPKKSATPAESSTSKSASTEVAS